MTPVLQVEDLAVSIDNKQLVRDVSFAVGVSSWLSIIGPNGAGKSTVLRAVAGAQAYTGAVLLQGEPAASMTRRGRSRALSWVPQTPTIPDGMRVVDYVMLGRTPHLGVLAQESTADFDVVGEVLRDLDLAGLQERQVETLSGGERQRCVIGRALAQQAPIVLLDEPTTALDLGHQQEVLALLDRLRRERGISIVSTLHDLTLAGQYADELVLMAQGQIVSRGSPDQVLTEANVSQHYGAAVDVFERNGAVVVLPVQPAT